MLIDPVTSPVTRRGVRAVHAVATAAGLSVLVTAGFKALGDEGGPHPFMLIDALLGTENKQALIIENRTNFAYGLADALHANGLSPQIAATDQQGLRLATIRRPDIVITNLAATRQRGTGILTWVREQQEHTASGVIPVIVYTAPGPNLLHRQRLGLCERTFDHETNRSALNALSILSRARTAHDVHITSSAPELDPELEALRDVLFGRTTPPPSPAPHAALRRGFPEQSGQRDVVSPAARWPVTPLQDGGIYELVLSHAAHYTLALPFLPPIRDGQVRRWLTKTGKRFEEGQPLLEVKAGPMLYTFTAPAPGRLKVILADQGRTIMSKFIVAEFTPLGRRLNSPEAPDAPTAP